jgi:DNA-directed RNA polymerase specialized sigma24 family protein
VIIDLQSTNKPVSNYTFSDKKLTVLLREGDKVAYSEIFVRYYDRLLYFAWQFIHDKETARDLVQVAFLTYWKQINKVSQEGWIYR